MCIALVALLHGPEQIVKQEPLLASSRCCSAAFSMSLAVQQPGLMVKSHVCCNAGLSIELILSLNMSNTLLMVLQACREARRALHT